MIYNKFFMLKLSVILCQLKFTTPYVNPSIITHHCTPSLKNYTRLIMSLAGDKSTCDLCNDFRQFKLSSSKLSELPVDKVKQNYVRRNVPGAIFSFVNPSPLSSPKLVCASDEALSQILDLDPKVASSKEFIDFVAGNELVEGSIPMAHRYGGHQFGYWAGQLGDGRAILLGEYTNKDGARWELQLKGSGKTPYSRDGDGRAVLRSSIREFLLSEAMYYLGVPTSRAGALIVSDSKVLRDPLYDGHPILESAAVVLRLAPSWFRIGSFEILARNGEVKLLEKLVDFVNREVLGLSEGTPVDLIAKIAETNCDTVAKWQGVGFTHGVLNSDNVSILGITIDYGPFGFLEAYDERFTPNHSDSEGRYAYGKQPEIMMYNLLKLVQAMAPLLNETQAKEAAEILVHYSKQFPVLLENEYFAKLGLQRDDSKLAGKILQIFHDTKADWTMGWRGLSEVSLDQLEDPPKEQWGLQQLASHQDFATFVQLYKKQLTAQGVSDEDRRERMMQKNPRYVLRNWIAEVAIKEAEKGNFSKVNNLLTILKDPFSKQKIAEDQGYANKPPSWANNLVLSCSS